MSHKNRRDRGQVEKCPDAIPRNNARYLWKRIPPAVRTSSPEIGWIWEVGQRIWQRDFPAIYSSIAAHQWSENIQPIIEAVRDSAQVYCKVLQCAGAGKVRETWRLRTAVLCCALNRADKVRMRRSRSVKTRRGRHRKKMGGPRPQRPSDRTAAGTLLDATRRRAFGLVAQAYTSISADDLAAFVGLSVEDAVKGVVEQGWQADSTTRMVMPKKPDSAPLSLIPNEQQLARLTDYVAFLEN
ncbi:unnamed protein product [Ranitomeya imitator]|uniref:CSN8/PSMD8/EIF3K domain-containing protein n=1 Tax=Ranitomeya imitator TaxID=111125 RepID=A0ABN9MG16_9NEOB|nr:unnamed protein product [Ranitomeya imitator]